MKKICLFFLLLLIPSVYSLGMASTYLQENTLKLKPGESYIYFITLQNGDTIDINAEFTLNSEIAEIVNPKETYLLKGKSYDTEIILNITIPKEDSPGKIYSVSYSLKPIADTRGQISMNFKLNKDFNVEVIGGKKANAEMPAAESPSSESPSDINIPLIMAILIIISLMTIVLLIKRSSLVANVGERLYNQKEIMKTDIKEKKIEQKLIKITNKELSEGKKIILLTDSKKYFYLPHGQHLKSINELIQALDNMSNDTFKHHVNEHKNDFANWISGVFNEEELAQKIYNVKSTEELKEILKNEGY
jgi:hypothetical protein